MSSQNLILFTTINGAEIIGELKEPHSSTSESMQVVQPLVIRPVQRGPQEVSLDLFPHSLANATGTHVFMAHSLMSISTTVPDELAAAYLKKTTGLILAGQLDKLERMG